MNTYTVSTAASCINNGQVSARAGWSAVLRDAHSTTLEIAGPLDGDRQTNQRAELAAVIMALKAVTQPSQFELWSDSDYVVKGINEWLSNWKAKGWKTSTKKPVENQDLWLVIDELLVFHTVTVNWVKARSGHSDLDAAATLSDQAAMFQKPHRLKIQNEASSAA